MGLEALSCVIPGQLVAASRELGPEPSHREPLRGDISGLFPFLNFFFSRRVTEKLFGGFETTFFADGLNLCRRRHSDYFARMLHTCVVTPRKRVRTDARPAQARVRDGIPEGIGLGMA